MDAVDFLKYFLDLMSYNNAIEIRKVRSSVFIAGQNGEVTRTASGCNSQCIEKINQCKPRRNKITYLGTFYQC